MPELPEVETIARELGRKIVGRKIKEVIIKLPKVIKVPPASSFKKKLADKEIKEVSRRGKFVILKIGSLFLLIHLNSPYKYPYLFLFLHHQCLFHESIPYLRLPGKNYQIHYRHDTRLKSMVNFI